MTYKIPPRLYDDIAAAAAIIIRLVIRIVFKI
jgi:hypothetical protein